MKELSFHDKVQIEAFRFFLQDVKQGPPPQEPEARESYWRAMESRTDLSPYTRELLGLEK